MKIAITGGHHSSALPVLELLQTEHPEISVIWFGHKHTLKGDKNETLEYQQITNLNIPFVDLPAGKFYKTYNLVRLLKIPFGFFVALFHLLRLKPDIILSFGGYLAVPVVLTGWLLRIPVATHEQTLVTGYANKLISHFADKIFISHEESAKFFSPIKTVLTGIPLRKALFQPKSNSFIFNNEMPVLYITAGKTGSHKINETVLNSLPEILRFYNVMHQCGDYSEYNDFENLSKKAAVLRGVPNLGSYYLRKFVLDDEIGEVFQKAQIFLTRAGAHITYEIKVFGKLAIMVPIPWVSHNEQYLNSQTLVSCGLAEILEEKDLSPENLVCQLVGMKKKISDHKYLSPEYTDGSARKILSELFSLYESKTLQKN